MVNNQSQSSLLIPIIALVAVVAGLVFLFMPESQTEQAPVVVETTTEMVTETDIAKEIPIIEEVVTETTAITETLTEVEVAVLPAPKEPAPIEIPELEDSDSWVLEKVNLSNTVLIEGSDLLSQLVTFIHNAAKGEVTYNQLPLKPLTSSFSAVAKSDDEYILSSANYSRYDNYVSTITQLPAEKIVKLIELTSPLTKQALNSLGDDSANFNSDLKASLDLLIETPLVVGDITLIAPSAMYQFKDPKLEALAPIQKQLIRTGPTNQEKLQNWFKQIRAQL
ncbi:DUF3014 domain-containing protein [Catenovulum sp. SM1970]|uniref:DUF3014 domain-containing protein n=1 Tax=Marinifaba aquimaris TaxID=2741323 RepID=UPI001574733F|nr:DUF3014 domain-containing protein [Marinifaba aquimaris]NTS75500.1 DUF3014 domain-containing protein [Marinifaba aquimaris]